jgi:hypothetical protein
VKYIQPKLKHAEHFEDNDDNDNDSDDVEDVSVHSGKLYNRRAGDSLSSFSHGISLQRKFA